jgi:hypothetical protein
VQYLVATWLAVLINCAALRALFAAWKPEGEWIAKLDLVESGDQLLVKEMDVVRREQGLLSLPAAAASSCSCLGRVRDAEVPFNCLA